MSAAAPPPTLPPPPERRPWWPWVVAALVAVAVGLGALIYRPFPTDEERPYIGWWYGVEKEDETRARAWIAEFAADGQIRIRFASYRRAGSKLAWGRATSDEAGTWRVRDGVQMLATKRPDERIGWYEWLRRLEATGHWRRVHNYRTVEINEREMRYRALPTGTEYHALRAPGPIDFPNEPLPPAEWTR